MAVAVSDRPALEHVEYDPDYVTADRCVALWRGLLKENIDCALGHGFDVGWREIEMGRRWLMSRDFDEVCGMAGFDPDRARASVLELIENGAGSLKGACDAV